MSCVVTTLDEAASAAADNRDDLALLAVAERLPALFRGRIVNPVVQGQHLDEGWSAEQRQTFVAEAQALLDRLREALTGNDSAQGALAASCVILGIDFRMIID